MGFDRHFGRIRQAVRLAVVVAVLAPAPSLAAYSAPFTLSQGGRDASAPQVAIDGDGDALIVWRRFDGSRLKVQARSRNAAGVLGPINTFSTIGDASAPQVAIDANGDALVVWENYDNLLGYRIYARPRTAAGAFGPVTFLGVGSGESTPQVAMDALGNAVISFVESNDALQSRLNIRFRSSDGSMINDCCVVAINPDPLSPRVAVNASGDAFVVWSEQGRIRVLRGSAAGGFSGPQINIPLSDAVSIADQPGVAIDDDGDALVVWRRFDGSKYVIQARSVSSSATLSPLRNISTLGEIHTPQVAVEEDGDALIVWSRGFDTEQIMARTRSATGTLGPIQGVSAGAAMRTTRKSHSAPMARLR